MEVSQYITTLYLSNRFIYRVQIIRWLEMAGIYEYNR